MMTEVQQLMTTVAMLQLTHGLSNLHVMHDEHPLMKKPFAWEWDLLLSDDTEDLDCKPPAKKTTPQATSLYKSPDMNSTVIDDIPTNHPV